ncbi:MAG: DUF1207 domain-containing protein [Ignavibacteria bacterium]
MRNILYVIFSFILFVNLKAQTEITFFPGTLNIQPFTANMPEPKSGTQFDLNNNELKLNIGNSLDIININCPEGNSYSFGADFFTFTLLRSETSFHFPVDAVDYLFGVNAGYKKNYDNREYGLRFRLSHISAHFADGHYDGVHSVWRNGQNPKVYSREFFEFMPYYRFNDVRLYAGLTYLFHVDPPTVGKVICQLGFDYFGGGLISKYLHPFIGADFKMVDINAVRINNTFNTGVKFGYAHGKGISVYYTYYNGYNFHGEYFNLDSDYSAIGFNLDL